MRPCFPRTTCVQPVSVDARPVAIRQNETHPGMASIGVDLVLADARRSRARSARSAAERPGGRERHIVMESTESGRTGKTVKTSIDHGVT